jgi:hypothetical protein
MAAQRTKTRRTKGAARKGRPISVRVMERKTGKVSTISGQRAFELVIGGITSIWELVEKLELPHPAGPACLLILKLAVAKAPAEALEAVYAKLGPVAKRAERTARGDNILRNYETFKLGDVSRETPRGTRRRKSPQLPATPRRPRG